jgi:hypothetical protein
VDRVHISVERPGVLGPPWTDGGTDRGGKRERGAQGARLGRHRSSSGAVEAGRRWCRTERRRRSVRTLRRRGERGKEVMVVLAFYRGRGALGRGGRDG